MQRQCADYLREAERRQAWPLRRMFHTPNGGWRTKAEAGRLKAGGTKAGVPDWLCPIPHKGWAGLAIELKSRTGRLSPHQEGWLADLESAGYLVGVARSLDEFVILVERYLSGRSDQVAIEAEC